MRNVFLKLRVIKTLFGNKNISAYNNIISANINFPVLVINITFYNENCIFEIGSDKNSFLQ